MVESRLPKPLVAGSIPVSRSIFVAICSQNPGSLCFIRSNVVLDTQFNQT